MDRYDPFIFGKEYLEKGEILDAIISLDGQQNNRLIDRYIDKWVDRQIDVQMDSMIYFYLEKNILKMENYRMLSILQMVSRQIDKWIDIKIDRQIDRQIDIYIYIYIDIYRE